MKSEKKLKSKNPLKKTTKANKTKNLKKKNKVLFKILLSIVVAIVTINIIALMTRDPNINHNLHKIPSDEIGYINDNSYDVRKHKNEIRAESEYKVNEINISSNEDCIEEGEMDECPISEVKLYESIEKHLVSAQAKYREFESKIEQLEKKMAILSVKDDSSMLLVMTLMEIEKDIQDGYLDEIKIDRAILLARSSVSIKNNLEVIKRLSKYQIKTFSDLKKDFYEAKRKLDYSKNIDDDLWGNFLQKIEIYFSIRKTDNFKPSEYNNTEHLVSIIEKNIEENKWNDVFLNIGKLNIKNQEMLQNFKSNLKNNLELRGAIHSSYKELEKIYKNKIN